MYTRIFPASGTDITNALEAAIASADPSKGGTIVIADGTWQITRPIVVSSQRNLHIMGEGKNTKLEVTIADSGFVFDLCAYSSLSNLRIAPMLPHAGYALVIRNSLVFKLENLYVRSHVSGTEADLPAKEAVVCKGVYLNGASNQVSDTIVRVGDHCLVIDGGTSNPAGFVLDKVTCHPSERYPDAIPLLVQNMGGGSLSNVSCLGGARTEFRNLGSNGSIVNSTFTDAAAATLFDAGVRNFSIANTWFGSNVGGLDLRGTRNMFSACNFRGAAGAPLRLFGASNAIQGSSFEVNASALRPCLIIDPGATSYIVNGNRMSRNGAGTIGAITGHVAGGDRVLTNNLGY